MEQNKTRYWSPMFLLFLFCFWAIGIVLAWFWGLGWFFLLECLRRLLAYVPQLNRRIRKVFFGKEATEIQDVEQTSPGLIFASRMLGLIIMVVWIGLTIFVFAKINIPLSDIFSPSNPG